MNIYLDLEATQFSREIISLGAVNEKAETFFSLVKPKDTKKITPLITKITGLTAEDFDGKPIPCICTVITDFWDWCKKEDNDIKIFVFGNFDSVLLSAEWKRYETNCSFEHILNCTYNLCQVANKLVYGLGQSHGLLQIYTDLTGVQKEQSHNPVDDANMLRIIHSYIKDTPLEVLKCIEENYYINKYIKRFKKKRITHNKLREYLNSLCDLELEFLQYSDIGAIIGYNHVEKRIKTDYLELTGTILVGDIYG